MNLDLYNKTYVYFYTKKLLASIAVLIFGIAFSSEYKLLGGFILGIGFCSLSYYIHFLRLYLKNKRVGYFIEIEIDKLQIVLEDQSIIIVKKPIGFTKNKDYSFLLHMGVILVKKENDE